LILPRKWAARRERRYTLEHQLTETRTVSRGPFMLRTSSFQRDPCVKAVKGRIDGNEIPARIAALNLVEEQREHLVVVAQRCVRSWITVP
jgi:hypothetical protein